MLKFEAKNWSKIKTLENNLNCWRAVLWTPNCPSKFSPRMQAKIKKKATAKKWQQRETQTLRSAERSVFGKNGRKFWLFVGPCLLAFLWPKASNTRAQKQHYKTRGFVVFLLSFFGWCALNKKATKQQNNKQQQTTTTNIEKEGKWKNEKGKNKEKRYPGKHFFLN